MALFPFDDGNDVFGQMDRMMNQMMGMGNMFNHNPFSMVPFGMGPPQMNPFGGMPNMFNMMNSAPLMTNTPGSFYSSSSFVSISNNGSAPQVIQKTNMQRIGPGGVREEQSSLRDSRTGVQKMSIGRHIKDRGHVIERSKNNHTGEEEHNNEYINIEEEEAPQFNQEWNSYMNPYPVNNRNQINYNRASREPILAITGSESHPHSSSSPSALSQSRNSDKKIRVKQTKIQKPEKKVKKSYRK